jgi:hypothetical protein
MKLSLVALSLGSATAFGPAAFGVARTSAATTCRTILGMAQIRGPSEKSQELRFGWDGTTALGGAVVDSQPARMLEDIRAVGETIPDECEVFNANVEMNADDLMFEDVMEMIDTHYESQLLEFKNGDILNKQGENEGSAKLLSYAALSNMDKDTTLKVGTFCSRGGLSTSCPRRDTPGRPLALLYQQTASNPILFFLFSIV